MTQKYEFIRDAVFFNNPRKDTNRKSSLKRIRETYTGFFFLYIFTLMLIPFIGILLILNGKMIWLYVTSVITVVLMLCTDIFEKRFMFKVNQRQEFELRVKKSYEQYLRRIAVIFKDEEINTKQKLLTLKHECEHQLREHKDRYQVLSRRVLDIILGVPIVAFLTLLITGKDQYQMDAIIQVLAYGVLILAFLKVYQWLTYRVDGFRKDKYLLDVINELEYLDDSELITLIQESL